MSRISALIAVGRRPIAHRRTYALLCVLCGIILVIGAVSQDATTVAYGLALCITTELWMIRKTIEAKAG